MVQNRDTSTGDCSGSPMTMMLENAPDLLRDQLEERLDATTESFERQEIQQIIDAIDGLQNEG